MKKRTSIFIATFLILGALAAIIFSLAIVVNLSEDSRISSNIEVKLQYDTQNVLNPIGIESIEECLLEKDKLCNINVLVEGSLPDSQRIGIYEFIIYREERSITHDVIRYESSGTAPEAISSIMRDSGLSGEIVYKAFLSLSNSYWSNPISNIGTFLIGARSPGKITIFIRLGLYEWSSIRDASGLEIGGSWNCRIDSIHVADLFAKVYVYGDAVDGAMPGEMRDEVPDEVNIESVSSPADYNTMQTDDKNIWE